VTELETMKTKEGYPGSRSGREPVRKEGKYKKFLATRREARRRATTRPAKQDPGENYHE